MLTNLLADPKPPPQRAGLQIQEEERRKLPHARKQPGPIQPAWEQRFLPRLHPPRILQTSFAALISLFLMGEEKDRLLAGMHKPRLQHVVAGTL